MIYKVPVVLADGHHREPLIEAASKAEARDKAATLRFGGKDHQPGPVPVATIGEPSAVSLGGPTRRTPAACRAGHHRWDFRGPVGFCQGCGLLSDYQA